MKLLGWIRSAVGFIKTPARPREAGPPPDVPVEIDDRAVVHDSGPDDTATRPDLETGRDIATGPESAISVGAQSPPAAESAGRISAEPEGSPSQEEIDRRRGIVRKFFNDYWSSIDDKPASFAERLDGAEGYINERVAAGGETWRLSPATRKQLGLPPSKKR